MSFSIAIDGPAGAGKSTVARKCAAEKGFIYIDTGAMYRAMALYLLRAGVQPDQKEEIEKKCQEAEITICHEHGEQVVLLNGENVNGFIRTEEVGYMASVSSSCPEVRKKMTELQRKLAGCTDVVMDGRDIGTCVLPHADIKIYLTAGSRVRAMRRYAELQERGQACDLDQIEQDIIERDRRDMEREIAPLCQAEDAVLVDSSEMSIDEVVGQILELTEEKQKNV